MPTDKESKLISLFFGAFVLLNFPIIRILGNGSQLGQIPLLYIYLFLLWAVMIGITFWIVERKNKT